MSNDDEEALDATQNDILLHKVTYFAIQSDMNNSSTYGAGGLPQRGRKNQNINEKKTVRAVSAAVIIG